MFYKCVLFNSYAQVNQLKINHCSQTARPPCFPSNTETEIPLIFNYPTSSPAYLKFPLSSLPSLPTSSYRENGPPTLGFKPSSVPNPMDTCSLEPNFPSPAKPFKFSLSWLSGYCYGKWPRKHAGNSQ